MRLFSLFAYIAVVATQQDPIQDFCRRHQHQTCVIDNKLYIDGGKVHYGASVENGSVPQQSKFVAAEHTSIADQQTLVYCGRMFWPPTTRLNSQHSTRI